jgi:hypothetical protein
MLQVIVESGHLDMNGSMQGGLRAAASASMSDSLIACQPRMLDPSKPSPSVEHCPHRSCSTGMEKVLLHSREVHEPEVNNFDILFLHQVEHVFRSHVTHSFLLLIHLSVGILSSCYIYVGQNTEVTSTCKALSVKTQTETNISQRYFT